MSRGIRNNNPGNIRENGTKWQGLDLPPSDGTFCRFLEPKWGIRAMARILISYQDKHGLNTIAGIINRWAPPSENNTASYIKHVCAEVGVEPDQQIDVHQYKYAFPLIEVIIEHENGIQPYAALTINDGLRLAGIEPDLEAHAEALEDDQPLSKSRTIKGQQVAVTGTIGASAAEIGQQITNAASSVQSLVPYLEVAKWVFLGLIITGICVTVYARWDDRKKGRI